MLPNHLPDHLLHRSSPARVLLPAHGAFGNFGPADGTDKVAISTVEYLEVGSHFIKADGALWDIWCTWSRRCGGIHLQKLDNMMMITTSRHVKQCLPLAIPGSKVNSWQFLHLFHTLQMTILYC